MFSKSRINETKSDAGSPASKAQSSSSAMSSQSIKSTSSNLPKEKPPASSLSSDLHFSGKLKTTGDIQVEGTVEGDIRAHLLTIGENATVKGEVIADDVVINGRIIGRVRGIKVRLSSTARVEGDIMHKTIAIENGAYFEGTVHRQDDPLSQNSGGKQKMQVQQSTQQKGNVTAT
ncbi:MAG: polymer-forming cytoskeletal protein [Aestuariivita sp.]|nr:polymer-forming cytoskeletal protein [Aestuariivita sp.]